MHGWRFSRACTMHLLPDNACIAPQALRPCTNPFKPPRPPPPPPPLHPARHAGALVGVDLQCCEAACAGHPPGAAPSARHARWAASLALAGMVEGATSLGETVLAWGGERCFSPAGLSAGQLQRLLADCGRWLGMAALVCESAGWWLLGTLCAELAGRATAGVPADLVQLMGVRGMTPARARALHEAGVCVSWGLVGGGWEKRGEECWIKTAPGVQAVAKAQA